MMVQKKDFIDGFFLVFVAKGDNYECSQDHSFIPMPRPITILPANRTSLIRFKINRNINRIDYLKASLITLAAIVIFYVVAFVMICGFSKYGTMSKLANIVDNTGKFFFLCN